MRVNAIAGPDATPSTVDDDNPNDQFFVKAQHDPTVTFLRTGSGPRIFSAWADRSLFDLPDPNDSDAFSVGWSAGDLSLDWPFHDLARAADLTAGDLPVPTGGGPTTWMVRQVTPKAAAIPPQSNVTGLYMVGMDSGDGPGQGQRIFVASSPDGQSEWNTRTVVFEPDAPPFEEPSLSSPYLTVWQEDPNSPVSMLVTWSRVPSGVEGGGNERVMLSISTDDGQTFSAPVRISDPDLDPDIAGFARLGASAWGAAPFGVFGDAVYVVWFQEQGGVPPPVGTTPDAIKWRRFLLDSQSWEPQLGTNGNIVAEIDSVELRFWVHPVRAPLNFPLFDQASVVVDHSSGRRGTVYVAFAALTENAPFQYDPDVFVATLPSGESGFRPPVKVNDDPPISFGGNPNNVMQTVQFMPWVAVTDQGHVGVCWYDRRDHVDADGDGQDFNRQHHYYFSYSVSGAQFFHGNLRVSDAGFPSDPGLGDVPEVSLGAYTSIGGVESKIFPLWVDLRDWDFSLGQTKRLGDIYSAEIHICEGNPPDYDNDCDVDTADFAIFAQCFGMSTPICLAWDFDFDGIVGTGDFAIFNQNFTGSLEPCDLGCQPQQSPLSGDSGSSAPSLEELLLDPDIEELYSQLEASCRERGISFP